MASFPLAAKFPQPPIEIEPGPGHYNVPPSFHTGVPVIHGHAVTEPTVQASLTEEQKKTLRKAMRMDPRHGTTMSDDEIARAVWEYTRVKLQVLDDENALHALPPPPRVRTKGNKPKSYHSGAPTRLGMHSNRGGWLWLKSNEPCPSALTTSRTIQPEPGAYALNFSLVHPKAPSAVQIKDKRFRSTDLKNDTPYHTLPPVEVESKFKSQHAASFDYHFRNDIAQQLAKEKQLQQRSNVGPNSYDASYASNRFGKTDHGPPRAVLGPSFFPGRQPISVINATIEQMNAQAADSGNGTAGHTNNSNSSSSSSTLQQPLLSKSSHLDPNYGISKRFPDKKHQPFINKKLLQNRLGEASPGPMYLGPQKSIAYEVGLYPAFTQSKQTIQRYHTTRAEKRGKQKPPSPKSLYSATQQQQKQNNTPSNNTNTTTGSSSTSSTSSDTGTGGTTMSSEQDDEPVTIVCDATVNIHRHMTPHVVKSDVLPPQVLRTLTTRTNLPMRGLLPTNEKKLDRSTWLKSRNVKARPVSNHPTLANEVKREIVEQTVTPGPVYNLQSDFKLSLREIAQMRQACRLRNRQLRVKAMQEEKNRKEMLTLQKQMHFKTENTKHQEPVEFVPFDKGEQ